MEKAVSAINHFRCELATYKIQREDDIVLNCLQQARLITLYERELIEHQPDSMRRMSLLIDNISRRMTKEAFSVFMEAVGAEDKMNLATLKATIIKHINCE